MSNLLSQDYYELASSSFGQNKISDARLYINKTLARKPDADAYFLSALIHEAEGHKLRALADYEAVIRMDPHNVEAYFQKGLIYYNTGSIEQAIRDFTYVIENAAQSETKAVYYAYDPLAEKSPFLATLQSMVDRVYQYRGMAYHELDDLDKSLADFDQALKNDTTAECLINRSQVYEQIGEKRLAILDLKNAISLDSLSYRAWYNLSLLDESTLLPDYLLINEEFTPLLNLAGANAYENGEFSLSAKYYTKAIEVNAKDDLAYAGYGKALLKLEEYGEARESFIKAMQLNAHRIEVYYLIGNSFFYERKYEEALGFYNQYLSLDKSYGNVWFNAAMAYMSVKKTEKGCSCLQKADEMGMARANDLLKKHCQSQ